MVIYKSEEVKPEKLDPVNDVIIALIGPLGSGKSQIIDTLTGQSWKRAGGQLEPVTKSLTAIRVLDHETHKSRVVLIDTPGFDSTPNRSERDIIIMIEKWLKQKSERNAKLAAVIYVHQIANTRTFGGTPHFNLRRLGELRGERSARNIVLVTTMWDKFSRKADNKEREDDLKAGYWNIMIQHGATVDRFENSSTSAWAIVDKIVTRHNDGAYRSKRLVQEKMRNLERIAAVMFKKKAEGKALHRYLQTLLDGRNDIDVSAEIDFLIQVESKIEEILQEPVDGMRVLLNTQFSIFLESYFAQRGEQPPNFNYFPSQIEQTRSSRTESSRYLPSYKHPNRGDAKEASALWKHSKHKKTKADDLTAEDVIIAVMGPTGSGKSTFISIATGEVVGTGADLESCTKEIDTFKVSFPGYNIVFIDTPGFDDLNRSDDEVFKMISGWLSVATSRKGILLSGLLYFHRISDNRMGGTPLKNLRQFEDLCGKKGFLNIVLTTTMWDDVDKETGEAREGELRGKFWEGMITRGSTITRFERTRDSAFQVIRPLLDAANDRHQLLLQKEVLDVELKLCTTPAGQKLRPRLQAMTRQQRELQKKMLQQLGSADNATALESSVREYEALKQNPDFVELLRGLKELGIPLGRRFVNMNMVTMTFMVKRDTSGAPILKVNIPNPELGLGLDISRNV